MVVGNFSTVIEFFSPEIAARLGTLITILQAVGWFIIFYIVFNIINAILNRKKEKELKKFFASLHRDPAFKKFPRAMAKFVFSGLRNKIKAKLMPWKEPKWKKVLRGED